MTEDIEKILTDLADLAVELAKGVEAAKAIYIFCNHWENGFILNNGFGESKSFLTSCESRHKRMALKKVWGRERDLKSEVLDYFNVTNCNANITDICRDLTIVTKQEKSRLRMILSRLVNDDKVLENTWKRTISIL